MAPTEYIMHNEKLTIAVVEDDSPLRQAIARLLDVHGYATETFSCAEDYLLRESGVAVDCLLLDIKLQGMSGIELHKELLVQGKAPPVIFITGKDDESVIAQAIDLGCIAFLHKPFESRSLQSALNTALRH